MMQFISKFKEYVKIDILYTESKKAWTSFILFYKKPMILFSGKENFKPLWKHIMNRFTLLKSFANDSFKVHIPLFTFKGMVYEF